MPQPFRGPPAEARTSGRWILLGHPARNPGDRAGRLYPRDRSKYRRGMPALLPDEFEAVRNVMEMARRRAMSTDERQALEAAALDPRTVIEETIKFRQP